MAEQRGWLKRIGPGLIMAALVLGPGSIVASSRAGAESEYRLIWVLALSCLFMAVFTSMAARLGCVLGVTPLQYVARRWGRWLAFILGFSAFLVTAGFQFGNNIGVAVALRGVTGLPGWIWPVAFTTLALVFLFGARHLYRLLEKLMLLLVVVMLGAFAANLFWAGFRPAEFARDLIPSRFAGNEPIIARAMLGTTFSAVGAFYQAYLVREKGWRRQNIGNAIADAWLGITVLGLIALVIMLSAAGALHGTGSGFENVGQLADQLRGALGRWATLVFCLGLAAASFSSFLANALIGGSLMADGLGQRANVGSMPVKLWTAVVMLAGCGVAVAVFVAGSGSTTSLLIAQAATLIAAPLCAIMLYGLTSSRGVMGGMRNRWPALVIGAAGLLVMLVLNGLLLLKLVERLG